MNGRPGRSQAEAWFRTGAFLVGLAWSVVAGCGAGSETAEEHGEVDAIAEGRSESISAPESESGQEPSTEPDRTERREHEGEHDSGEEHDSGGEHGEESGESGIRYGISETASEIRNGIELILRFDASAGGFVGTLTNTGGEPVSQVRVEVHLIEGPELGPTPRITLAPGETSPVRLEAGGRSFETWTAHVEIGEGEHSGRESRDR